jgi:hypothetical protein
MNKAPRKLDPKQAAARIVKETIDRHSEALPTGLEV